MLLCTPVILISGHCFTAIVVPVASGVPDASWVTASSVRHSRRIIFGGGSEDETSKATPTTVEPGSALRQP